MVASDRVDRLEPGLSSASEPRDSERRRSELEAPMFERFEEEPQELCQMVTRLVVQSSEGV